MSDNISVKQMDNKSKEENIKPDAELINKFIVVGGKYYERESGKFLGEVFE